MEIPAGYSNPQQLCDAFLKLNRENKLKSDEGKEITTDDARLFWSQDSFTPMILERCDKIIFFGKNNSEAVCRVSGKMNDVPIDFYIFTHNNEGSWKIANYQHLIQTPQISKNLKNQFAAITSAPNKLHPLMNDAQIKTWFLSNQSNLAKLVDKISQTAELDLKTLLASSDEFPKITKYLKKYELKSVTREFDGNISFIIDESTFHQAGITYSAKKEPPVITHDGYIWVEELAPSWYLYRVSKIPSQQS